MPRLGAHLSIAGGLPRAVDRAVQARCDTLQIFTKSAGQWRARPIPPDEIAQFKARVADAGVTPVVAHTSYLINIATAASALRSRSVAALTEELDRAEALGLFGLILHPGSAAGPEEAALAAAADSLGEILATRQSGQAMILLEHTAGQGTTLGYRFEHLAAILDHLGWPSRVGVCLDTCHLVAAGYDITTEAGYLQTFETFAKIVGLDRLKVFHLNDSKRPCGSRVDRHEHIGKGCVGLEAFRRLLSDPRFAALPMLLETPKSEHWTPSLRVDPLDRRNLRTLRHLLISRFR